MARTIRRRDINTNARKLVQIALNKGQTYEDIAETCGVSPGTVKRWLATGRADTNKIKELESDLGRAYLSAEVVGDTLIEIYMARKRRYIIKRTQLKRIAGRTTLKNSFLDEIYDHLIDNGYYFLEAVKIMKNGDMVDVFIIIRVNQLLKYVKDDLKPSEINRYFKELADEYEDDDDDDD